MGSDFILPALDLDLSLSPAPGVKLSGSTRGLADLSIGNGLHWTLPGMEVINGIDFQSKTGSYEKARLVNPGQDRTVVRLVNMATWTANPEMDFSYRLNWDYHQRNSDTGYRSGQLLNLNYAIGWKLSPGLSMGPAGYLYRQLSDDNLNGRDTGNRLRINGVGFVVKQFFPTGKFVSLKFYREAGNRNAAQGNVFWLNGGLAL